MRGALVGAALLAACSRGPDPVHVRTVALAEDALSVPLREAGLDDAALDGAAREALRAAGFLIGDGPRPHRAVLSVEAVRFLPDAAGPLGPRAEVTVELALVPIGPGQATPRREMATAAVPVSATTRPRDAWLGALSKAAERAAEGLALAAAADGKATNDLLADLAARDPRVREQAARVVGERRSRAAVPILVSRMKEEEPRVAQRIAATLAQIGDERAVPALIEASRGADPVATSRMVRYIGDIGGAEAEGYLLTLEAGHPNRAVRTAAREALDDLSARARGAPVAARR